MDPKKESGIRIAQIFLDSVHFEHHPEALKYPPTTPVEDLGIEVQFMLRGEADGKTAAIKIQVRTTNDEESLYRFTVELVAIAIVVEGRENLSPLEYLKRSGPTTVYPFVREAVANVTGRGRFGPIYLSPLNVRLTEEPSDGAVASVALSAGTPTRRRKVAPRKRRV